MSGRARALRRAIPHAVVPVLVLPAYGFRTDPPATVDDSVEHWPRPSCTEGSYFKEANHG
jgi:hypothetical protein